MKPFSRTINVFISILFYAGLLLIQANMLQASDWIYDIEMPTQRAFIGTCSHEGRLWVAGGYDGTKGLDILEVYDTSSGTWEEKASMPGVRYGHVLLSVGNVIYAIGGHTGSTPLDSVVTYDPSTDSWSSRSAMQTARHAPAGAVWNNKIYIFGGDSGGRVLNSVEIYDPATDTWSYAPDMPTPRLLCAAAQTGNKFYVAGGFQSYAGSSLSTLEIFDPVTQVWSSASDMANKRLGLSAIAVCGKIFAMGGDNYYETFSSVEIFDPATGLWTQGPSMDTKRREFGTGIIDGRLFAVGGFNTNHSPALYWSTMETVSTGCPDEPSDPDSDPDLDPGETTLSPPENVHSLWNGDSFQIIWDGVAEADGYTLSLGVTTPGQYGEALDLGLITSLGPFPASILPPGTYYLALKAYRDGRESVFSNEVVLTITTPEALSAPVDLRYTLDENILTLNWNTPNSTYGTLLFLGFAPGNYLPEGIDMGSSTQFGPFDITGISQGNYYFAAKSYQGIRQSDFSNEIDIVIKGGDDPSQDDEPLITISVEPDSQPQTFGTNDKIMITVPGYMLEETEELNVIQLGQSAALPDDLELDATFDISLGDLEDLNGVLEIEIPYDPTMVPDGMIVETYYGALYYNEGENTWDQVDYEIKTEKPVLLIHADHLSTYAKVRTKKSEATAPMARTRSYHFLPSSVFQTDLQQIEVILNSMDTSGKGGDVAIKAGWENFAEEYGITAAGLTFVQEALEMSSMENVNDILGELGLGMTFIQLALEMNTENPDPAILNFTKNMTNYSIGKWSTSAMKIASVGIFLIDYSLNKFAQTAIAQREQMYVNAYNLYYKDASVSPTFQRRRTVDWFKVFYQIVKTAESRENAETEIAREVDEYVKHFWNDMDGMTWAFEEVHAGFTYTGGLNPTLENQISENHKAELVNGIFQPVFAILAKKIKSERIKSFKNDEMKRLGEALNVVHTVKVTVTGAKSVGGLPVKIVSEQFQDQWQGVTDNSGKWEFTCTLLGYINAGLPSKVVLSGLGSDGSLSMEQSFVFTEPEKPVDITFEIKDEVEDPVADSCFFYYEPHIAKEACHNARRICEESGLRLPSMAELLRTYANCQSVNPSKYCFFQCDEYGKFPGSIWTNDENSEECCKVYWDGDGIDKGFAPTRSYPMSFICVD